MRIFASDWVQKAMKLIGMKEDDVIEDRLVSRQIEKAQRKVEAHNFDIRKNLLDFDDVNNDQRKVIYNQRDELLDAESVKDNIDGIRGDVVEDLVAKFVPPNSVDEQWDLQGLEAGAGGGSRPAAAGHALARRKPRSSTPRRIAQRVQEAMAAHFEEKEASSGRRRCVRWRSTSCSPCSTRAGRSTWPAWITCARASTCAAMRRSSPSRNTRRKPSSCSPRCWRRSSAKW